MPPNAQLALTGLCFYLVLTLHYEWIHFLVHRKVWPRTKRCRYGVTMLSGDRLLGTAPKPSDVPVSPTARTLGAPA